MINKILLQKVMKMNQKIKVKIKMIDFINLEFPSKRKHVVCLKLTLIPPPHKHKITEFFRLKQIFLIKMMKFHQLNLI